MEKSVHKLTVVFSDGSLLEIDAADLTSQLKAELNSAIADKSQDINDKYVLLEWQDGWKEVVRVPADSVGVVRYYVIERSEHTGRLVIERKDSDYPELLEITRKAKQLKKVTIV